MVSGYFEHLRHGKPGAGKPKTEPGSHESRPPFSEPRPGSRRGHKWDKTSRPAQGQGAEAAYKDIEALIMAAACGWDDVVNRVLERCRQVTKSKG